MEIKKFPFQSAEQQSPMDRIKGKVIIPQGSRVVHVGAEPPNGEMYMYCEVSPVTMPDVTVDIAILKEGDVIPTGYQYRGYILAIPILFVYERKPDAIIT